MISRAEEMLEAENYAGALGLARGAEKRAEAVLKSVDKLL
jgi:hypothetical protein